MRKWVVYKVDAAMAARETVEADSCQFDEGALVFCRATRRNSVDRELGFHSYLYRAFAPGTWASVEEVE